MPTSLFLIMESSTEYTTTADGGGVFFGLMVFLFGLMIVGVLSTVFWVWMLVDAAKAPEEAWQQIGQNKTLWIVLAVLLGPIISLIHFFWLRKQLKAVATY